MFLRLLPVFCLSLLSLSAYAAERATASSRLAEQLLRMAGSVAVFDAAAVQAALAAPSPFVADTGAQAALLQASGLRPWQPPRLWVLQEQDGARGRYWQNLAPELASRAAWRGLPLVTTAPLPHVAPALAYLRAEAVNPGLRELLSAYGADGLVLVRGKQWQLWLPAGFRQGTLVAADRSQLVDQLAEASVALQQWPQAAGQPLLRVEAVAGLADFARLQALLAALPGVQRVQLVQLDGSSLWFALVCANAEAVQAALATEAQLPLLAPALPPTWPVWLQAAREAAGIWPARRWQPQPSAPAEAEPAAPGTEPEAAPLP